MEGADGRRVAAEDATDSTRLAELGRCRPSACAPGAVACPRITAWCVPPSVHVPAQTSCRLPKSLHINSFVHARCAGVSSSFVVSRPLSHFKDALAESDALSLRCAGTWLSSLLSNWPTTAARSASTGAAPVSRLQSWRSRSMLDNESFGTRRAYDSSIDVLLGPRVGLL